MVRNFPPSGKLLRHHKYSSYAVADIFVINEARLSRLDRARHLGFAYKLPVGLVKTDYRALLIVGELINL
jgi:hypothetical protein